MGLGKTMQVAIFLEYLAVERGVRGPHLVVAPLSVLPSWQAELARWSPSLKVLLFYGNEVERGRLLSSVVLPGDFDVLLTSYEQLVAERRLFGSQVVVWRYLVFDEAQRLKNWDADVAAAARRQACYSKLLLTGTPLQNNLRELWSLLRLLFPEVFGGAVAEAVFASAFTLTSELSASRGAARVVMNPALVDAAHALLAPLMLRRTKASVRLALPPKIERLVFVPLSPVQHAAYKTVLEADANVLKTARRAVARSQAAGGGGGAAAYTTGGIMNVLLQLRKVCNHPALLPAFDEHPGDLTAALVRDSGKAAMLDKILTAAAAAGDRVVIFSQWTQTLDVLEDVLTYRRVAFLRLDGGTSFARRKYAVRRFSDPDDAVLVFLVSTRAGGVGLNLQAANVVVMYDSDWNPSMDRQAQDRVHRIGQTRPVTVYRLATRHTCEERILYYATEKAKLGARVLRDERLLEDGGGGGGGGP
ncbi:hypothetical protein BU14_0550s0002 [Porphyra umbilicalis]|uniref:Chromatin-remodeling ATPase INO80 n=1 Tax=Porphyra umbilicalis TaxID=2786 RepID=A0A1X6NS34_PORUM|nr:hypothetical protein BU14_0550s0002 [Porphyra umbilicalis]|eukprot:OSX71340.1 hypothetical protein BU14_0550s0002 [Porphyra umbilicalis]